MGSSKKGPKGKGSKKRVIEPRDKGFAPSKRAKVTKTHSAPASHETLSDNTNSASSFSVSTSMGDSSVGEDEVSTVSRKSEPTTSCTADTPSTVSPSSSAEQQHRVERKSVLFCDPPVQDLAGGNSSVAPNASPTILKPILKSSGLNVATELSSCSSTSSSSSSSPLSSDEDKASILADINSGSFDIRRHSDLDTIFKVACDALLSTDEQHTSHLNLYIALNTVFHSRDELVSTELIIKAANNILAVALADLEAARASLNKLDLRDIVQIIRLVDYMFFNSEIALTLKHELVIKFLYFGVSTLENHQTPKSIAGAYLHMFNYQHLPKPMSETLASRLLVSIASRPSMSSAALLTGYITCLRVLLQSHPGIIATHCSEWIPLAMKCLINSNSTVRQEALLLMQESSRSLLPNYSISNAVRLAFDDSMDLYQVSLTAQCDYDNSPSSALALADDGQADSINSKSAVPTHNERDTYINIFCERLTDLLSIPNEKGHGSPMSIWSIAVVFLAQWSPQPSDTLGKWEHFGKLLSIAKVAFNSDIISSKLAAINSWRVLIDTWFSGKTAVGPSMEEMRKRLRLLLHPLISLIPDKRPVIIKHVSNTYVYLVNVALKYMVFEFDVTAPGNVNYPLVEVVEHIWSTVITPALTDYFGHSALFARDKGVDILAQLLSVSAVGISAASPSKKGATPTNTEPSLLSALPSRFIRVKPDLIMTFIFEEVYTKLSWSAHTKVWHSLLSNIKASMKREIQVSSDTMNQIASICNYITRMASHGVAFSNLISFVNFLFTRIGTVSFLDRELLNIDGSLVASPQNRKKLLSSSEDISQLPVSHIWKAVSSVSSELPQDNETEQLVMTLFDSIISISSTQKKFLTLILYFVSLTNDKEKAVFQHMPGFIRSTVTSHLNEPGVSSLATEIADLMVVSHTNGLFEDSTNDWMILAKLYVKKCKSVTFITKSVFARKTDIATASSMFLGMLEYDPNGSLFDGELLAYILNDLANLNNVKTLFSRIADYLRLEKVPPHLKAKIAKVLRANLACYINGGNSEIVASIAKIYPLMFSPLTADMMADKRRFMLSCVDVISEGLLCQDQAMVSATIKAWNSQICCDKNTSCGPYPMKLVDAVTTAKVNRRRIKIPKDLEVHSFRSSARANKAVSGTPSVTEEQSSAREPISITLRIGRKTEEEPATPNTSLDTTDTQLVTPTAQTLFSEDSTQSVNAPLRKRSSPRSHNSLKIVEAPGNAENDDPPSSPPTKPDYSSSRAHKLTANISSKEKGSPMPSTRSNRRKRADLTMVAEGATIIAKKQRRASIGANDDDDDTQPVNVAPLMSHTIGNGFEMSSPTGVARDNISDPVSASIHCHRSDALPTTPPRNTVQMPEGPLTPEFSSPPRDCRSAGRTLLSVLKNIEADICDSNAFKDLSEQERFETESLLIKALYKTRFCQTN